MEERSVARKTPKEAIISATSVGALLWGTVVLCFGFVMGFALNGKN